MPKILTSNQNQSGAALIELAIVLPLFLGLLFGVLWVSQLYHAQSTLTTAVGNALRLGITRGNHEEIGDDVISDIQGYVLEAQSASPRLKSFLISGDFGSDSLEDLYGNLNPEILDLLEGISSLQNVSPQYLYAMVYIKLAMKNSLGPAVRFPCNPDPGPGETDDGAGCLLCVYKNPDTPHLDIPYPVNEPMDFPNRIAIECRYQPGGVLSRVVHNLIGLASRATGGKPPRIIMNRSKASEYL